MRFGVSTPPRLHNIAVFPRPHRQKIPPPTPAHKKPAKPSPARHTARRTDPDPRPDPPPPRPASAPIFDKKRRKPQWAQVVGWQKIEHRRNQGFFVKKWFFSILCFYKKIKRLVSWKKWKSQKSAIFAFFLVYKSLILLRNPKTAHFFIFFIDNGVFFITIKA